MGGCVPEAVKIAGPRLLQLLISQALPFAKTLFRKIRHLYDAGAGNRFRSRQTGADDRRCRLVRTAQIARHPNCCAWQLFGEAGKKRRFGTVTGKVRLAIDPAALGDGRVPPQPEARRDFAHRAEAVSSITISPTCWKAPRTSPVWPPIWRPAILPNANRVMPVRQMPMVPRVGPRAAKPITAAIVTPPITSGGRE